MLSDCTCSSFLFGWYSRTHFVCQIATKSMGFFIKYILSHKILCSLNTSAENAVSY